MDIRAIYDACMADSGQPRLSATDVGAARRSPFSLYCRYHADPTRMDPPDPFLEALSARGIEHESAVLASDYPDMEKVTYGTPEEGFMAVLESMAAGTQAVSNLPLFYLPEGMHGYPDVLEKKEGGSAFGGHHYLVREIKAARNIKEHHIIQAAFYALMLGHIQQRPPEHFMITNGDGETIRYEYRDYDAILRESIIQAGRIRDGLMPPAIYGRGAPPWSNYCNEIAIINNDVSLIPGIGPGMRTKMVEAGLRTIQDVASSPAGRLLYVKGIGGKTSVRYHSSARAIVDGKCVRRPGKISLPERSAEVFLDLEGVGGTFEESYDYLIGALVRVDGAEEYHPFVAEQKREDLMLGSFLEFMSGLDDYVIYHWGLYERTRMRAMMDRHGMPGYRLFGKDTMVDLLKVATGAFAFPTYRNSIKDVARWLGFEWRHNNVGATSAIELYLRYAEDPGAGQEGMNMVIDYNEDDCMATRVIKDWLASRAR